MDQADGGNILASANVYEVLRHRERYMSAFIRFDGRTKHDEPLPVYQFVLEHPGLSRAIPRRFIQKPKLKPRVSDFAACYMAFAKKHSQFLAGVRDYDRSAGVLLLYYACVDELERVGAGKYNTPRVQLADDGAGSIEEALSYYATVHYWVRVNFARSIEREYLHEYAGLFEGSTFPLFLSAEGERRLDTEAPAIKERVFSQSRKWEKRKGS